jgi:hypothetical protein
MSGNRDSLYPLGLTKKAFLPEDGDGAQPPKRSFYNKKNEVFREHIDN